MVKSPIRRMAACFASLAAAAALVATVAAPVSAEGVTHLRDFVGTWNSPGSDLTTVKITKDGGAIKAQIWTNCGDEQCYVGEFDARRYRTTVQDGSRGTVALRGLRTPSFATVTYIMTLRDGNLYLQQMYDFNEGDSRADYYVANTLLRK